MNISFNTLFNYNRNSSNIINQKTRPILYNSSNADTFTKSTNVSSVTFNGQMIELKTLEKGEAAKQINADFKDDYINWNNHLNKYMKHIVSKKLYTKITPNTRVEQLNNIFFAKDNPDAENARTNITRILKNGGITNCREIFELSKMYDGITKEFPELKRYALHFINAFSKLNDKYDLTRFPNSIAIIENSRQLPDGENNDINDFLNTIKALGFKSEKELLSRFDYLKDNFNDFKNPPEILYLINYLSESAAECEKIINSFTEANPEFQDADITTTYCRAPKIFDYFQNTNYDYSEQSRNAIIKTALDFGSVRTPVKTKVSEFFDIQTTEGKIELYSALSEQNLSVQTLNNISRSALIQDSSSIINSILYKNTITEKLIDLKGLNKEGAEEFYLNFVETISSVFDINNETSQKRLQDTLKVIDEFGIKNDSEFIALFNAINSPQDTKSSSKKRQKKAHNTKNKISKNDIKEFVDLLLFADKEVIKKFKSNKNYPIKQELLNKKENYEKLKPEIEKQLSENDSIYFAGQSAFEVFMENQDLLHKDKNGRLELFNYADLIRHDKEQNCAQKTEAFNTLLEYFQDKTAAKDFIIENEIKLDSSYKSRVFRKNIIKILAALNNEDNPKFYYDSVRKLTKSGFIRNSKSDIGSLIGICKNELNLKAVLRIALNRELESPKTLTEILQKYSDEQTGNFKEILGYIKNLPLDISLEEFVEHVNDIQSSLTGAGIPIKITGNNICLLNPKDVIKYQKGRFTLLMKLAAQLSNKKHENFIAGLSNAFAIQGQNITPKEIAREIVKLEGKNEEYANITRELRLSRKDLGISNSSIDEQSKYLCAVASALSEEFVSFVNSDDWINFAHENATQPNLTLHAKLRAIERLALNKEGSIKYLYTDETKTKMKNLFKTIYNETPEKIEKSKIDNTFIAYFNTESDDIKAVFNNNGKMVTIIKTD